jgi:uncharacterized protein (DUF952 family)
MIFKIAERAAWAEAKRHGRFTGSPDDLRDGFIHLSAPHQVAATAARHFKGKTDLVLVAFDEAALADTLRWEPSRGGDLFPHAYGPLSTELALWERPLATGVDGVPQIPEDLVS